MSKYSICNIDRFVQASKVAGIRQGAGNAVQNIDLADPENANSIVRGMLGRVRGRDKAEVLQSMKDYGLVTQDSTLENVQASAPEQFLKARAAMRASAAERDDRLQAAGYSFNISTDAHSGKTRIEANNSNSLTTGNGVSDITGVSIKNPKQAALAAAGIHTVDAYTGDGTGDSGDFVNEAEIAVGGVSAYMAADRIAKTFGMKTPSDKIRGAVESTYNKAKGKSFDKQTKSYHNPETEVKAIDKDGKVFWTDKDSALADERITHVAKDGNFEVYGTEEGLKKAGFKDQKSISLGSVSGASRNADGSRQMSQTTKMASPIPMPPTNQSTVDKVDMSSSLLDSGTNIHPESENVKGERQKVAENGKKIAVMESQLPPKVRNMDTAAAQGELDKVRKNIADATAMTPQQAEQDSRARGRYRGHSGNDGAGRSGGTDKKLVERHLC